MAGLNPGRLVTSPGSLLVREPGIFLFGCVLLLFFSLPETSFEPFAPNPLLTYQHHLRR